MEVWHFASIQQLACCAISASAELLVLCTQADVLLRNYSAVDWHRINAAVD